VLRSNWEIGPFLEELSLDPKHVRMGRLQSGAAPFLANHDSYDVAKTLGVVERANIGKGGGTATIRFVAAGIDPEADAVFAKIADGVIRSVSVGYRVFSMTRTGEVGDVPVMLVDDWEVYELSAVAIPADAGATFRSSPKLNPCVIRTTQGKNMDPNNEVTPGDLARGESERVSGIMSACRAVKLGNDVAQKLIQTGTPLDKAREIVLDTVAMRADALDVGNVPPSYGIEVGETDREKWMRGVEAALLQRAGVAARYDAIKAHKAPDVQRAFKGFDPTEDGGELRGYTMMEIARECLERSGVRARGMREHQLVTRALETPPLPISVRIKTTSKLL
jgi:hypothetical protein